MPSTELIVETGSRSSKSSPSGLVNGSQQQVKMTTVHQEVSSKSGQGGGEPNGHLNGFQEEEVSLQGRWEKSSYSYRQETRVFSSENGSVNHTYQTLDQDGDSDNLELNGSTDLEVLCRQTMDLPQENAISAPAHLKEVMSANGIPDHPSLQWKKSGKEYLDGPDQVLPSEALCTWYPEGAIKIISTGSPESKLAPVSVPTLLERAASRGPNMVALAVKREDIWIKWTYDRYLKDVRICAKAFIHLGLERFHGVCIIGFNSPEWYIADMAAIFAGGFAAGIYTTNSPEACFHCAENSKANIIVVEDDKQLQKILQVRSKLPHLKAIVQYAGTPKEEGVLSWSQLMFLGSQQNDTLLNERLKRIAVNQCCTLIYTSGTTGLPKGVMVTHDNLSWTAAISSPQIKGKEKSEVIVSYLPLSHIAAQVLDIYFPIFVCSSVYFAGKDALKGGLAATLKEVRPTIFLGVPRVWEKINEKMVEIGRQTKGVKRMIAAWAKGKGLEYAHKKMSGEKCTPLGFSLANALVFRKVRQALGLDRCKGFYSSAAPISVELLQFFHSLNIPLMEGYGMSESCGPQTLGHEENFKFGSIGSTVPGMETRLDSMDKDGNGEVCMRGRHIFAGYLEAEEKTMEAKDPEGWLHSGDIGRMDGNGLLYITGRIKELVITAGGENVAPVPIEDAVKSQLPCISNAMLIGDKRKFLTMLLTLKTEMDMDTGEPRDVLTDAAKRWCQEKGSTATTVSEILASKDEQIYKAIQEGINRANQNAISNAQRVQKWVILPKDFSIPGGELGPTMKLKRYFTVKKHSDVIENLYAGV